MNAHRPKAEVGRWRDLFCRMQMACTDVGRGAGASASARFFLSKQLLRSALASRAPSTRSFFAAGLDADAAQAFPPHHAVSWQKLDGKECVSRIQAEGNGSVARISLPAFAGLALKGDRKGILALRVNRYRSRPICARKFFTANARLGPKPASLVIEVTP